MNIGDRCRGMMFAGCCCALLFPLAGAGGANKAPEESASLSGEELVRRLTDAQTRSPAFYELTRRSGKEAAQSYEAFLEGHCDPAVVVCPQGGVNAPLYLVLSGYFSRDADALDDAYKVDRPEELFPPLHALDKPRAWDEPAIAVFTSKGNLIEPFGGDDMLNTAGVIADINGDGVVERANPMACCVDGIKGSVDIFQVLSVREKPQVLLSVLYNWDGEDWSFLLTDADKDGVLDIEFGTKIAGGIKTKVAYTWDASKKAYVGPEGKAGDHFRRLKGDDVFEEFDALRRANLVFPADPDYVDERGADDGPWGRLGRKKPSPKDLSKPYQYASLKKLSNADIVRYMGNGKAMWELEAELVIKTQAPTNFWQMPPKAAASAYAEMNRYPDNRALYRLALDGRDGQKPPAACSLAFTYQSARCYSAVDGHFFLRVDPAHSYLAYARSREGGVVFYNAVYNAPAFDFRFCELSYEDARQIADTVWWLDRVRSKRMIASSETGFSAGGSTADGYGSLVIRTDDGTVAVRIQDTLWADHVSERWGAGYSPETCLNLASYLIGNVLPQRLGQRWTRFEPKHANEIVTRQASAPQYEPDEVRRILIWAGDFLDLFSPDQKAVSFALVREAARAAGGFADTNQLVRLERVQKQLQALPAPARTPYQIEAEMKRLDEIKADDEQCAAALKRWLELSRELRTLESEASAQELRRNVTLALRKIRLADDAQALQSWACARDDGSQWALQRLKGKDRKRYVAALEWWMANSKEEWARQAFDAIAAEDSKRADQLAGAVAPDKKGELSVSAFGRLKEAGAIPDEKQRVGTLIQIALDPKSGWEQRREALQLLVPAEQPMRYPDRAVDEALVKLFDPHLADEIVNFTLSHACRALAARGRVEYFERMSKLLAAAKHLSYGDLLGPLVQLAQLDPGACNKRLEALLKPELTRTGRGVTDVLLAIWAADLRNLEPDVRRLATSGPDDYEDERSNSYRSQASDIQGRFHVARQILSLWEEEDLVTRCRLLIAFGYQRKYDFVGEPANERLARLKLELAGLARELNPSQKQSVAEFLTWCQADQMQKELYSEGNDYVKRVTALMRAGLALP